MIRLLSLKPTAIVILYVLVVLLFSITHISVFARNGYISTTSIAKQPADQVQSDYQPGDYPLHPVTWTEGEKVVIDGSRITKTSTIVGWNAGAVSSYRLGSGEDGKVVIPVLTTSVKVVVGLAVENVDAGIDHIDYGLRMYSGQCYVYERGVEKSYLGSISAGDQLEIERIGGVVYYVLNEEVRYVSSEASTDELMVDTSIIGHNQYVDGVQLSDNSGGPSDPASAITVTEVTETSSTISWTSGNGAGRMVVVGMYGEAYPVDGTGYEGNPVYGQGSSLGDVQYVVYEGTGTSVSIEGLMPGMEYGVKVIEYDEDGSGVKNYNIIEYATGSFSTVSGEDYPLHPVTWTEGEKVVIDGSRITKTSTIVGWNAGAVSSYRLGSGEDGKVVIPVLTTSVKVVVGLAVENVDAGIDHIDYGLRMYSGQCYVYERGVEKSYLGSISAGDQLEIER